MKCCQKSSTDPIVLLRTIVLNFANMSRVEVLEYGKVHAHGGTVRRVRKLKYYNEMSRVKT